MELSYGIAKFILFGFLLLIVYLIGSCLFYVLKAGGDRLTKSREQRERERLQEEGERRFLSINK